MSANIAKLGTMHRFDRQLRWVVGFTAAALVILAVVSALPHTHGPASSSTHACRLCKLDPHTGAVPVSSALPLQSLASVATIDPAGTCPQLQAPHDAAHAPRAPPHLC